MIGQQQQRYCLHGHDTWEAGRTKTGRCWRCHQVRQTIWRRRTKAKAITLKGAVCQDCGFDFLKLGRPECAQFDHREGREQLPRGVDLMALSWTRLQEELKLCDLVCANCHQTRTCNRHEGLLAEERLEVAG